MTNKLSQSAIIICSDCIEEQQHLLAQISPVVDDVISCSLNQFEAELEQHPSANVVVSWRQPSAELRLIIDICREKQSPLLVLLKQLNSNDISRLPETVDYVLLPRDTDFSLLPWIEHARLVRQSTDEMKNEVASLSKRLDERKEIEKAKELLMKMHQVDGPQAYKAMQKSAMQSSQSLVQVARNLLQTLESLS